MNFMNDQRLPKSPVNATIDSVAFETTGFSFRSGTDALRAWSTPEGDGIGICFFGIPPDIPKVATMNERRLLHESRLAQSGGGVIEMSLVELDACLALKTIVKVPQRPRGLTFIAAFTFPFRDFSFVLKVQCEEHGVTGTREFILFDRRLSEVGNDQMQIGEDGRVHLPGFEPHHERFDAEFPSHPLSRARRAIDHIARTARVDPSIKTLPPFDWGHA